MANEVQQKNGYCEAIASVMDELDAETVNVWADREFWVTTEEGVAFPVSKVTDYTTDCPFYHIEVKDYEGKSHSLHELTLKSCNELFDVIYDIL